MYIFCQEKSTLFCTKEDLWLLFQNDLKNNEVIENIDLADYDIRFVQKQIELNRDNYLETWIKNTVNTNRLP